MRDGIAGTLVRWLLPALLAVALLGMHHLLTGGEPVSVPVSHELTGPVGSEAGSPPVETLPATAHGDEVSITLAAEPTHDHPAGHGAGHELLHLCLAVLTAVAGVVLVLFPVARHTAADVGDAAVIAAVPAVWARPPPPLARRLAALGVLRL